MTEEEIKARLDQNPSLAKLIEATWQSGHRAGLEEGRNTFVDIVFSNWLYVKLKDPFTMNKPRLNDEEDTLP